MSTVARSTQITGLVLVTPTVHTDERGMFVESFRQEWFEDLPVMIQGNRAERRGGSLVGLHYHLHQVDYWYLLVGRARAVLHDLRVGSPTEGATVAVEMDAASGPGIFIPRGVAHGFAALTDMTLTYLVDRYYDPSDELGVAWDDPDVAADWGLTAPVLSARDLANPRRRDLVDQLRPHF
jgi:dTDP-4-dehydrorhamnose 3,5-epimerase